jgi:hypothetical protein
MHHKWKENIDKSMQNNQWSITRDQLPKKSPIELKDNSKVSLMEDFQMFAERPT